MRDFVALNMSREEYHMLVRLVGHHTNGDGLSALYERLCDLRPIEAAIATNKGPLSTEPSEDAARIYGKRPMVTVNA